VNQACEDVPDLVRTRNPRMLWAPWFLLDCDGRGCATPC